MKPNIIEEDGIQFKLLKFDMNDPTYLNEPFEFETGYYKVITIKDNVIKTQYFKNGTETSKERIIQDERIKSLRR